MRLLFSTLMVAFLPTAISACSSEVDVARYREQDGTVVSGIPFRVRQPTEIKLYEVGPQEAVKLLKAETKMLADLENLYLLRYTGAWLSDGTLVVEYAPDGGLKKVQMMEESQAADALKEVGTQITAVQTARRAQEDRESEAEKAQQTAATAKLDDQLAFEEALIEVQRAELKLAEADQVTEAEARLDLELAKLRANDKAERLGIPPVYDVAIGGD
jgi:hypothetical protein